MERDNDYRLIQPTSADNVTIALDSAQQRANVLREPVRVIDWHGRVIVELRPE